MPAPAAVVLADITGRDADGELIAVPTEWDEDEHGPAPEDPRARSAPRAAGEVAGVGDRALLGSRRPATKAIRSATAGASSSSSTAPGSACSAFSAPAGRRRRLAPIDKKQLGRELRSRRAPARTHEDGDLVAVEVAARSGYGLPTARVKERLGSLKTERAVSLIAIHAHGIPHVFRARRWPRRRRRSPPRQGPRGLARAAARHHRPGRRQGSRRRGARRARHRSGATPAAS